MSTVIKASGGLLYRLTKRVFDLVVSAVVLVIAAPLLLLIAVAVRLESAGSPIYKQRRVGLNEKTFEIYKLRTMVTGAESIGPGLAINTGDARITRVGSLLRRTSLDELPNLFNVFKGEMSLIGPRPTVQVQVDKYTDRQRARLAVKPGITGWAQVNGRASLPWNERIELDIWYVENRSIKLDLSILLKTPFTVLSGGGLYKGASGGWKDGDSK